MNSDIAWIISGGEFCKVLPKTPAKLIIACDKGCEYALRLGLAPDVVLGDFDSLDKEAEKLFPEAELLTYPVMKDDTDTMLAIKLALDRGFRHIIVLCGLGGRMDHLMANIESLHYIAHHGGVGEMYGNNEHLMTLGCGDCKIMKKKEGYSLSLFSLTDTCEDLTIRGAKYNVEGVTLTNNFPLGHGNSFVEDEVFISISSGILLIVESKLE